MKVVVVLIFFAVILISTDACVTAGDCTNGNWCIHNECRPHFRNTYNPHHHRLQPQPREILKNDGTGDTPACTGPGQCDGDIYCMCWDGFCRKLCPPNLE